MASVEENLKYLSELTGMECKAGDYRQITRAASYLYVDGHNYMMSKDWTQLNDEKLDQLCSDMKTALSKNSKNYVARMKWNDPYAEVYPIFPQEASQKQKKNANTYWNNYKKKRKKYCQNSYLNSDSESNKYVKKAADKAFRSYFKGEKQFWENGKHVFHNFNGGVGREKTPFIRLVLQNRGLSEEEVLNPDVRREEKRQVIRELKEIIDADSELTQAQREEKMKGLALEAETALFKKKFKPYDKNDINRLEAEKHNKLLLDDMTGLYQIALANKDNFVFFKELEERLADTNLLIGSYKQAEESRGGDGDISFDFISFEAGAFLQCRIDEQGLEWNEFFKNLLQESRKSNIRNFMVTPEKSRELDQKIEELFEQFEEAETEKEKESIYENVIQIEKDSYEKEKDSLSEEANEVETSHRENSLQNQENNLQPEEADEVETSHRENSLQNQENNLQPEETDEVETSHRENSFQSRENSSQPENENKVEVPQNGGKGFYEEKEQPDLHLEELNKEKLGLLLEELNKVDPAYMVSSKEFKALKKSLVQANNQASFNREMVTEIYEKANAYIMQKSAAPSTQHGVERLTVARKIRNVVGAMINPKNGYDKFLELADWARAPKQKADGGEERLSDLNKFAGEILQKKEIQVNHLDRECVRKITATYMDMEFNQDLSKDKDELENGFKNALTIMRAAEKWKGKNGYIELKEQYKKKVKEGKIKKAETPEEKKDVQKYLDGMVERIAYFQVSERYMEKWPEDVMSGRGLRKLIHEYAEDWVPDRLARWKNELKAQESNKTSKEKEVKAQAQPAMKK